MSLANKKVITSGSNSRETVIPSLLIDLTKPADLDFSISGILILKSGTYAGYKSFQLTQRIVEKEFNILPSHLEKLVHPFIVANIDRLKSETPEQPGNLLNRLRNHFYLAFRDIVVFNQVFPLYYKSYITRYSNTETEVRRATISNYTTELFFEFIRTARGVLRLVPMVNINEQKYPLRHFERYDFLLKDKSEFFLLRSGDAAVLQKFPKGYWEASKNTEQELIDKVIAELGSHYEVRMDIILENEEIECEPEFEIALSELSGSFLMITPKIIYNEFTIELNNHHSEVEIVKDLIRYKIKRNIPEENETISFIRSLHPKFAQQKNKDYLYVSFAEAERAQWFVKFYKKLINKNISFTGMDTLKHFRYNINTPEIKVEYASKGIDWFDLKVSVAYGDIKVPLKELQKAIQNKQPFIMLTDGTLGVIPDEWKDSYHMIFKLGNVDKDKLRLSKFHWTFAKELETGEELTSNIFDKKKLQKWSEVQLGKGTYPVPGSINATLREYQKAGFDWLCFLDEMQWGGCLADDMGLGKTLQTICFLQHICDKYKDEVHLIICPTSLIYNWENEIKKFAPDLTYSVYHGTKRDFSGSFSSGCKLVITSYGTVKNDIELFEDIDFGYIICDESHYMKNVSSYTAKALRRLKSRNRIILSGTPVQNNTSDLYSQMHFVNPGLLGPYEFFKREFAKPIDVENDKTKAESLRKLIYPFLLRRTKEQVVKDLPPKTEVTLWCEMGDEQKKVYEQVKAYYRESILHRIDEDGIKANSLYILEGLSRLRQICNSPRLLNNDEYTCDDSAKLDVLMDELTNSIGNHRVLVFSQFTGMLRLISEELDNAGMPYLYLDGKTKATDRQKIVDQFQSGEKQANIFLISLKAGGVGLNLTAADYVYLVDPWWNPAAEQQAIDRTHRIGQQQSVFAYKMICRGTIEEKIIALQERKKALVADLISEEPGFIKALTSGDIDYLFS